MNNSGKLEVEMVTLVRSGEIFSPDPLGEKDILILDPSMKWMLRANGFFLDS
jgi:hypothetical protein